MLVRQLQTTTATSNRSPHTWKTLVAHWPPVPPGVANHIINGGPCNGRETKLMYLQLKTSGIACLQNPQYYMNLLTKIYGPMQKVLGVQVTRLFKMECTAMAMALMVYGMICTRLQIMAQLICSPRIIQTGMMVQTFRQLHN